MAHDQSVRSGQYGNTSEYPSDLIRRDQDAQAMKRLRELLEEGLASGPPTELAESDVAAIRKRVRAAGREPR